MFRDPDPGSGMGEKRTRIRDPGRTSWIIFPRKILKFFDADSDPGGKFISGIRKEKFGSGTRNKHPGFATLEIREDFKVSFSSLLLTTLFLDKPHWFLLSIEEILKERISVKIGIYCVGLKLHNLLLLQ